MSMANTHPTRQKPVSQLCSPKTKLGTATRKIDKTNIENTIEKRPARSMSTPKLIDFSWFWESKTLPDPPREAQGAQEGPRWVPGGSPGSPGGGPRPSQGTPGAPQGRPGEPQGSPKVTQKLPKALPREENGGRNAPKVDLQTDFGAKPHSKRFSIDFPSNFHQNR